MREAIRKNVEPYEKMELQQEHWSDDQLLDFMIKYPILINRPFVVTNLGIKLCRPSELVLDILSSPQLNAFSKEDGEIIIDHDGKRIN